MTPKSQKKTPTHAIRNVQPPGVPHNAIWKPNPGAQTNALRRAEFEVLYGGARGGGKTDAGIAWLLKESHNPKLRALVLRRNSDDLRDWVDRAEMLYSQLPNKGTRVGNPSEFRFQSGAIIRTGHLKDESSYTKYQGHEYQRILIEELTQIPDEARYLKLLASCRSTVPNLDPRVFATTNPGEVGHMWVKQRFIDVTEWGKTFWYKVPVGNGKYIQRSRIFIHATMDDNPILVERDPGYVATIEQIKDVDEETYRAWRFGDWEVFSGQVFDEFRRNKHVIPRMIPKRDLNHFLWMDWGYSENSAFAAYLSAVFPDQLQDGQKFNRVITYKEFYGNKKTPDQWAEIIYNWCKDHNIKPMAGYTDPAMHNPETSGAKDIASQMEDKWRSMRKGRHWINLKKGNNTRTGRVNGVAMIHNWLSDAPDGIPYWIITENNANLIRTLPMLVYDDHNVEDVDTTQEDHCLHPNTKILTTKGWISIQNMPQAKITGYDTIVIDLITNTGRKITCTPNHKMLTISGWKEAGSLRIGEKMLSLSRIPYKSSWEEDSTNVENTIPGNLKLSKVIEDYILKSGSFITAQFQKPIMSTTLMETEIITPYITSNSLKQDDILAYIPLSQQKNSELPEEEMRSNLHHLVMQSSPENNVVEHLSWVGNERRVEKVYDIGVEHPGHAFIANGFVVSNSYDSTRYGLSAVKFTRANPGQYGGFVRRTRPRAFNAKGQNIGIDLDKFKQEPKKQKNWQYRV